MYRRPALIVIVLSSTLPRLRKSSGFRKLFSRVTVDCNKLLLASLAASSVVRSPTWSARSALLPLPALRVPSWLSPSPGFSARSCRESGGVLPELHFPTVELAPDCREYVWPRRLLPTLLRPLPERW